MARRVRIVVGEGRTAQRGLLRFVLEGEGFDVVGEAKGTADLSAMIEAKEPDVVVLDDGIGVVAVSMVHEVAPRAKIVLVWPAAVVPIGGDARVEPAKILRDLGAAVTHVMAPVTALTETFERPDWIDRVRKDPATLRSKLSGAKDTKARPSVTRLQRRSKRLHPTSERPRSVERSAREEEEVPAPVVVLPVGVGGDDLEPVLDIGGGPHGGAQAADDVADERSEWNRRLGTLALSGAAAVSALVLALALGGGRVSTVIRGSDRIGLVPIGVPGFSQGGGFGESPFGRGPGAGGLQPGALDEPGSDQGGGAQVDGGLGGDLANPGTRGGSEEPPEEPGGGGTGAGGDNTGGNGGNDGDGGAAPSDGLPGKSAEHNPHGGPPGQLGITPAHGPGLGASAEHGSHDHSHKH